MSESTVIKHVTDAVIRFAGDSGDGMQLTGGRFTENTAILGHDLVTLPDYPAEIRAPAGSLAGVSAFQIHFSSNDIHTPGDEPDVLVAMNPAALKVHLKELHPGGIIIVNRNAFTKRNLHLAGYESNPLDDDALNRDYTLYAIDMSSIAAEACKDMGLTSKVVERTKNMFALGVLFWMYDRPYDTTIKWLEKKFHKRPELVEANRRVLVAGFNYGDTYEIFTTRYKVAKAPLAPGNYRNMNGNLAVALGLVAAAQKAGLPLFYGGYPITPASEILQTLAGYKRFGVKTFQAEDEIAGVSSAIGAAFAGNLAVTATSGPGVALKSEALGLALMVELPLVLVNVQRGGPSTGLPTKTEQSDLFQAMYGRNGEAPIPIVAPTTPGDCFYAAYEAARIALKYMTPVIVLSDGYLANGSEPWSIPDVNALSEIEVKFATEKNSEEHFLPYLRNEETLSRPWAIPGTPGLEHRIGGLEKENVTGSVSYDPDNHHKMTELRAEKVHRIANELAPLEVFGAQSGDLLILGWGSTYGACRAAAERMQGKTQSVGHLHLRWLNPFPNDLGEILTRYKQVLIPEINYGQLSRMIRAEYLVDTRGLNMVRGRPIRARDVVNKISELLG
ncbi:MAG: 2-oxoacid:acceptor oxidoreductase subunit alpha [FCB group bacterium]|nr:2-oxoacid:acceptor oxidoreductase subunit alpha [FCB group bacterium]